MFTPHQVADFFIPCADPESGDLLTHLKLQKLLYYAQGWRLALRGTPLFEEDLVAWPHGPVCPSVFQRFKHKGWNPIENRDAGTEEFPDGFPEDFLAEVWSCYGGYSAKMLENMTHAEDPWKLAFKGGDAPDNERVISKESMRDFFRRQKNGPKG